MVLPEDNLNLFDSESGSAPSRTWSIDKNAGRIAGECDGIASVRQAVEIILNTERYRWQIYRPSSGVEYDGLVGADRGYVAVELGRRIEEALKMDDRVLGIENFSVDFNGSDLSASFTVQTVFGLTDSVEVAIR